MKNKADKGHKQSMNIIWNKLMESRAKYWIHLEDDFAFIRDRNYVFESIKFLDAHKNDNIKQIVFNNSK